jgi:hypothetical protein
LLVQDVEPFEETVIDEVEVGPAYPVRVVTKVAYVPTLNV